MAHVMLCSPRSRMDVLTDNEIDDIVRRSKLAARYNQVIDTQSAYEILNAKLEEAAENTAEAEKAGPSKKTAKEEESAFEKVANNSIVKSMMRTAGTTIVRSLLGSLGLGGKSRKKKSNSWF